MEDFNMALFTNKATLSYNGNITNSNIVTGQLLEVISATKTAIMSDYLANDDITYVINIVNSGATAITGLTVTDNLGSYTSGLNQLVPLTYITGSIHYFINGVLQAAPTIVGGPPLVISGINIPANGNALIVYKANVNQYAPLDTASTIVNEAEITGSVLSAPVSIDETITIREVPVLTISKSLSPTTVTENGQLTYTFTIENSGNTEALVTDNIIITDTFNPILNPISVSLNGTAWSDPINYTYDPLTGLFTTVSGQITVPAATYTQDPINGNWIVNPGVSTLVVTGTV